MGGGFKTVPFGLTLVVSSLCIWINYNDGLSSRFSEVELVKINEAEEAIGDWGYPDENLVVNGISLREIKGTSSENILFIGASHIEHTYPYVKNSNTEYNVYYMTQGGCFVAKSYRHPRINCSNIQNYEKIFEVMNFDKIVVSLYCLDCNLQRETESDEEREFLLRVKEFNDFLLFAKEHSDDVYIILGEPKGEIFDPKMSVRLGLPDKIDVEKTREVYNLHYRALGLLNLSGVNVIDPIEYLCDDFCYAQDNDKYIYKDQEHIRPIFAEKLFIYLDNILQ